MKKLFLLPVLILFLISCKKDAAKPDTPKPKSDLMTVNAQEVNVFQDEIIHYGDTSYIDFTKYDDCTLEDIQVTGKIIFKGTWVIKNDTLDSYFRYKYDSVTAVGLTTGKKYKGQAHYIEYFKIPYPIVNDSFIKLRVMSRIVFRTAGRDNDLVSIANHTIRYEDNGTLKIEKITNEWSCK